MLGRSNIIRDGGQRAILIGSFGGNPDAAKPFIP